MRALWLLVFGVGLSACGDSSSVRGTRSLQGSGDVAFICAKVATNDENLSSYVGRPLASCPDVVASRDSNGNVTPLTDGEQRELLALVTQSETGEVALVRMLSCHDGGQCQANVLDLEPTQPGVNFMAVGAEPASIVSTPGGVASFVSVAEPGKEGIFALPTSCVAPRPNLDEDESGVPFRDITTWPACSLPVAPGEMEVLFADAGDLCGGDGSELLTSKQRANRECPADLSLEVGVSGRHKLAVALPSIGKLAIIDAQTLLDRTPGSFDPCPMELVDLAVERPAAPLPQSLPEDVAPSTGEGASCEPISGYDYPAQQEPLPYPSDFARHENRLYVADQSAPVVHVLDVADACNIAPLPSLLPQSFLQPEARVTTRKVAVSPVTPSGKQFVYAVDNTSNLAAGSVMVFDVSEGASQRTPLVRPRSRFITSEAPDRIAFDEEIADVAFASQDLPVPDPVTGVAVGGLLCDPDPAAPANAPAVQHRPGGNAPDAAPEKLRGVFGFVVLHSGLVTVIDVEDLDAPCRRPRFVNPDSEEDYRGCESDPYSDNLTTKSDVATVTDEQSCHVIQPHRVRASSLFNYASGGNAPRLRGFPQLRDEDGSSLAVDQSEQGRNRPRLLAASPTQDPDAASLVVGATEYSATSLVDPLPLDPALAERNSLVLPVIEPRAYIGSNVLNTVTFEGVVRASSDAPFELVSGADLDVEGLKPERTYGVFQGGVDGQYCGSGIEDVPLAKERAQKQFSSEVNEDELDEFSVQYSDYVNVTADLLEEDHSYWRAGGQTCGENLGSNENTPRGRQICDLFFGTSELPDAHREFRVLRAFNSRLIVEPRNAGSTAERQAALELLACCFPRLVEFEVRAQNQWVRRADGVFEHDVRADPETLACKSDCNSQAQGRSGRVFEISCDGDCEASGTSVRGRVIGPSNFARFTSDEDEDTEPVSQGQPPAMVCVLDEHPKRGLHVGGPAANCVQDSLTARFGIFRGLSPSRRDMQFSWRTVGGFGALAIDLLRTAGNGNTTSPRRIEYLPNINRLVVADGGSIGLEIVNLRDDDGRPIFGADSTSPF